MPSVLDPQENTAERRPTMLPPKLSRYVLDSTALHQIGLLVLTVVVFLIEVVPLELQRRIVNNAVKHRDFSLIITLCAVYAGVTLVHGLTKLVLNVYRAWVAQRATQELRKRVRALEVGTESNPETEDRGVEISMIVAEAEPIGMFVAEALSEPLLQGGILVSVLAYMFHIDPLMTFIAIAIFLPQLLFVPLMQGAINWRTKKGISILRLLSASLTDPSGAAGDRRQEDNDRIDKVFSLNKGVFKLKFSMNFLMNLCTHLQIIAALLYGSYLVLTDQLLVGGVVAFISGVTRLTDPWGDLVNYFRDLSLTKVKYLLLASTVNQIAERHVSSSARPGSGPR
jgi:ABC-type bacteriocin/lantibiotic exporter with double-glycine peptidase domain